ncbi:hypothetical protein HMN09_00888600 [Mycena chlorophos]|uniref:Uncharacterized protein n=1 Tax=Mycena chlorophos TaxID=658473 RepID=A0A8H6SPH9_MYCCL|nr:hypothetical protein HMN09_00888600 [Mycena chlorophos]
MQLLLPAFLRKLWPHPTDGTSIPGLWDDKQRRGTYSQTVDEWRNELLLLPRRDALANGVVVTHVEHLQLRERSGFRVHALHEPSGRELVLDVERRSHDVVHRGAKDGAKRKNAQVVATLTFPPCERPRVIQVAFVLCALSRFRAPEIDGTSTSWFVGAACECLQEEFKGGVRDVEAGQPEIAGANAALIGSVLTEYRTQMERYLVAFEGVQGGSRDSPSHE